MRELRRGDSRPAISIAQESAATADGRRCLAAYFAELAERFDQGFDAGEAGRDIGAEFAPPRGAFFVARLAGEAIGCGGFMALDAQTAEIKRVWTSASARGLGAARAVLSALEAEAKARGFRRLRLDTNRALVEAQTLYLRRGYRDIERYNDNPYAHRWFEKTL